ncbi:Helicase associated domain protein [Streptomyces anulatus]|uniref:DEAD/DEAH box helicase n=1 Tax=Streptomyces anulatus TaxID=1892 RepID=UPI002F91464E
MLKPLREHQADAVVGTLRELEPPSGRPLPPAGLRTQVVMATGSGKTLVAVHTAEELAADRVLVLVPSLDLLDQTARAWRDGGRTGTFFGVSSLKSEEAGFPHTTDPAMLVKLTAGPGPGPGPITVFATYASLGLGILTEAHVRGLPRWNLIVVDEAHRTSGRAAKPWAVIHDNQHIPSERRLYMTATPRVWQAGETEQDENGRRSRAGELVASMLDDPDGLFGKVAYSLPLRTAIDRGIVAPYQVLVVDVQDPALNTALRTAGDGSEEARGKRLAALQAATIKVASKEKLRRVLSFHQRVAEAEAFARGLPGKAGELHATEPALYPAADEVWAEYLHGEHKPSHRRSVLGQLAAGVTDAALSLIASVKVLGEGVDTRECDAVVFADVRGSMPDLVQAVGRALRMHPGEGKIATLVVPVFLGPGETPDAMLTSPAYAGLAKLLTALRAHDARIEKLTEPGRNTTRSPQPPEDLVDGGDFDQDDTDGESDGSDVVVSQPARELLRFSAPRDAHQLAGFMQLRVLDPERVHWRRGIQAAQRYIAEHSDLRVPYAFRTPADWSPADFPLGVWTTDCRRLHNTGRLNAERVRQLEKLGMVWSSFDAGFEEGLAAAAAWADEHGVGLAAPVDAVHGEYPVGRWLKNQRAAARRADELERLTAAGQPAPDGGATPLPDERRAALDDIDPGWCPAWDIAWQRCFRLARNHSHTGAVLPDKAGLLVVNGEDLGQWAASQRAGFSKLTAAQQWMLGSLGIQAAPARLTRAEMWAQNLSAARRYRDREGHLEVPRSHTEKLDDGHVVRLGAWISQQRTKAAKLAPERTEELSILGMRWS